MKEFLIMAASTSILEDNLPANNVKSQVFIVLWSPIQVNTSFFIYQPRPQGLFLFLNSNGGSCGEVFLLSFIFLYLTNRDQFMNPLNFNIFYCLLVFSFS